MSAFSQDDPALHGHTAHDTHHDAHDHGPPHGFFRRWC